MVKTNRRGRKRKTNASRQKGKKAVKVVEAKEPIVLLEDRMRSAAIDARPVRRVRRVRETAPRVQVTPPSPVSRREVEERVRRAFNTLRAMPDRDRPTRNPSGGWPDYVRDYLDAYDPEAKTDEKFIPTPADVSDYLTALSWTRHLHKNEWRLLWWRSFDLSYGLIAEYIGRSDETVRRRYEAALTDVWIAANNISTRSAA